MRSAFKPIVLMVGISFAILVANTAEGDEVRDLEREIKGIEETEGLLSPGLYAPLLRLGRDYQTAGQYERAIDIFRRMQNLVHQHDGVYSPLQTESVEFLIRTFIAAGQLEDADTQHLFLYGVAERNYEVHDVQMNVARLRLANWYRSTSRFRQALTLYEDARPIITTNGDNLELVKLLRSEALTLYLAGRCCASRKLEVATEIAATDSNFDPQDKARVALEYADMLQLERQRMEAQSRYLAVQSVNALKEDMSRPRYLGVPNSRSVIEAIRKLGNAFVPSRSIMYVKPQPEGGDWLATLGIEKKEPLPVTIGKPVPMCSATIEDFISPKDRNSLAEYYADVTLQVDVKGRPHNITMDGNTPARLVRYLRAVLEESRYSPAIGSDGEVIEGNLVFRQTFAIEPSPSLPDNLSGWNALLTSQTCARAEQIGATSVAANLGID